MTSPCVAQSIEISPIERLVEYPRNPRKNDAAVDRMCGSIREFGFKIPLLARGDGEIVDGPLRLKAARKLGITEIPVILCDEWSPPHVKAFRLMVNRSVSWAEWDDELLGQELLALKDLDFDLGLTGFEDEELARLLTAQDAPEGLTDEDSIPKLPEALILRGRRPLDSRRSQAPCRRRDPERPRGLADGRRSSGRGVHRIRRITSITKAIPKIA
jgi:ParB-like chromosome segregation protein Spo0J